MQHYKNTIFKNLLAVIYHLILILSKLFNEAREQSMTTTQNLRPYFLIKGTGYIFNPKI